MGSNKSIYFPNGCALAGREIRILVEKIAGWVNKFDNTPEADEYLDDNPEFKKVVDKL